ncbi:unnamed protein product [Adineta ricciae]|uniref:t-SNARE coiled-coil homology domain-containing protein n=1 Tax=Adineta ricciae TaxID=249248 RepID=A0A814FBB1_ADIRI|nr:unnamed protein product [Adineta ricciae]
MSSRNLTSNFLEFRNRAVQNRTNYTNNNKLDDRSPLLNDDEDNEVVHFDRDDAFLWMESYRRMQSQFDEVRNQIKKLQQLQAKCLTRPGFDENDHSDFEIRSLTKDITSTLNNCRLAVQKFSSFAKKSHANSYEQHLVSNVVQATINTFQDLMLKFNQCQSNYVQKLQSQKDKFDQVIPHIAIDMYASPFGDKEFDQISLLSEVQQQCASPVDEYTIQRDKEIRDAYQSIQEVNSTFMDVSTIIFNQKASMDQIECVIGDSINSIEQGNKELVQAVTRQQRRLKIKLILLGIGIFILLFVVFISYI